LPFSASSRFTDSRFCVEKEMYADGRRLPVEDDTFGGMILLLLLVLFERVASRCDEENALCFRFFENFFEFFDKTREKTPLGFFKICA